MENEKRIKNESEIEYLFLPADRKSELLTVIFSSSQKKENEITMMDGLDCHKLLIFDDFVPYEILINEELQVEKKIVQLMDHICKQNDIQYCVSVGTDVFGASAVYYGIKYDFDVLIAGAPHYRIESEIDDESRVLVEQSNSQKKDELEALISGMTKSKKHISTKIILCISEKDSRYERHINALEKQLKQLKVPYFLDKLNYSRDEELDDYFDVALKKHLSMQGFFPRLIDYEIELIKGHQLQLTLLTASSTDLIAIYFYRNERKLGEINYSLNRISHFDISAEGEYSFKIFMIDSEKKKKHSVVLPVVTIKKDENGQYKKEVILSLKDYRLENYNKDFLNHILPLAAQIPDSNGSRFYPMDSKRIGIVCDEFFYHSLEGIANLTYINRTNYKEYANELDLFLVVTTWKGIDMDWVGLGNVKKVNQRAALYEIIDFYKMNDIPVAFFSKEDPVNYEVFIDIAKHCDFIFTTAKEKVASYKEACQTDHVYVWSFGVNPLYHNPIGIKKFAKEEAVLFAGSWYEKYPKRQADTKMIFDGIISSRQNLNIIDRNFNLHNPRYFFPRVYTQYTSPPVKHEELQNIHKLFNWSLNFNSVTDSLTMCANRVYELQALGNIVLSNYSLAVENKFPHIPIFTEAKEVKHYLDSMTSKDVYEKQMYGIRRVMSHETTYHRLIELYSALNLSFEKLERKVLVLIKESSDKMIEMFNKQSYMHKGLLLESEFSDEIKKQYDMIAFFDEMNDYVEFYLEDMINGFKYTDSDYITKGSHEVEFDYVTEFKDKYKTVFWSDSYSASELLKFKRNEKLINGFSIYFN